MPASSSRDHPRHRTARGDDRYEGYDLDGDIVPMHKFARRLFLDAGRVSGLRIAGESLPDHMAPRVTSDGTLSLSRDAVAELALTFAGPDYRLLGEDRLNLGNAVDWADLGFRVAAVEDDGQGNFTLTARDAAIRRAKRKRGPDQDRDTSPTTFLARRFRRLNLEFVGEPSPKRRAVGLMEGEPLTKGAARLAAQLGYVFFACRGIVYFGRPSWLRTHGERIIVHHNSPWVRTPPQVRASVDNEKHGREVTVELEPPAGDRARPGMALELPDVPLFDDEAYLVDTVAIPLNNSDPVVVTASTPVNPVPEPFEKSGDSSTGRGDVTGALKARSYAGEDLSGEQLRNAEIIYEVGRANKVGERGILIALMAADVESTFHNYDFGDRDSLGMFQQRTPWGSRKQRLNPRTSSLMFYTGGHSGQRGLLDIDGWRNMPLGKAAQAVQVSAYPSRYAEHENTARAIVDALQEAAEKAREKNKGVGGKHAIWPTTAHRISTPYHKPGSWAAGYHTGVDIDGGSGDPVWSPIEGRVVHAGFDDDYGRHVIIRGPRKPGGREADVWLCHLSRIDTKVGKHVQPHTHIGLEGNTGRVFGASGGYHLHVEVRPPGGDYGSDMNPMPWVGR